MSSSQLETKGFFAALFDFGITSFITLKFLRLIYGVLVGLILLTGLVFFIGGLASGGVGILFAIVFVPLLTLLYLIFARIWVEVVALFFRIGENTSLMVAALPGQRPPGGPFPGGPFPGGPPPGGQYPGGQYPGGQYPGGQYPGGPPPGGPFPGGPFPGGSPQTGQTPYGQPGQPGGYGQPGRPGPSQQPEQQQPQTGSAPYGSAPGA